MADIAGIFCVIVPVLAAAACIVLLLYSVGELRLMVERQVWRWLDGK